MGEQITFGESSMEIMGDPETIVPAVRSALRETAPNVPVFSLSTLEEKVDASLVQERMVSTLSTWFGVFALLLAAVGQYGRLDYAVAERTREIGIRFALGAQRPVVFWRMMREVFGLVLCGVVIGLPFGLPPFHPSTLTAVVELTAYPLRHPCGKASIGLTGEARDYF